MAVVRVSSAAGLVAALALAGAAELPADPPAGDDVPIGGIATDLATIDEYRWVEAATRRRQRIETTPQPVAVILPDDLVLYPAITLADRLRTIGGIDVQQSRHGQIDVGMRGFAGTLNPRLLVTLGPLEFRQEEFGAVLWRGVFFASDIERVEVLKGPGSVAWGANAFGGVVAVREREVGDAPEVRAVGSLGAPRANEGDLTITAPLGRGWAGGEIRPYAKLSVGATRLDDLDGVRSGLPRTGNPRGADTGPIDTEGVRAALTLGVRSGRSRFELGGRFIDLSTWEMVDDLDAGSNNDPHRYRDLVARAVGPWGEITHTYRSADNAYENQKVAFDPTQAFRYTQGATDNDENVTRMQVPILFGDHALRLGGEVRHWRSRSNLWTTGGRFADPSTWRTVETTQAGVYAEDQWAPDAAWTFTAGVRADHHSRSGRAVSPRLAVNYNPDADHSLLASLSHGYRTPTPIESFLSEFYYTSNPDLSAERVTALELAASRRIGDGGLVGINAFASRASDLIWILPLEEAAMAANYQRWLAAYAGGDTSAPLGPILQFANLATPLVTFGAELSGKVQATRELTLWGNATVQRVAYRDPIRFQSDGFIGIDPATSQPARLFAFDRTFPADINAPPRAQLNLGALWRSGGWFASAAGRGVTSREVFALSNSYILRDGQVAVERIPGYACLDLAAGYRWGEGRWLRVVVMDVLDTQHAEGTPTTAELLRRESEDQQASTLGRMLAVQGAWRF